MGKQICFFATQQDINTIIEQIYLYNGLVVDLRGVALNNNELQSITDFEHCKKQFDCNKFFATKENFAFHQYFNTIPKSVDETKAEVIELNLCTPLPIKIIDTSIVDDNFKKNGFVIIDDSDEYYRQMNELMKNPTYIDNPNYVKNGFENGRIWYSSEYYDCNGNKVQKSRELDILFNNLSKFIKKNFKQSKDKFAYIGPDAYQKYIQKTFIPCSARTKIEF